MLLAAVAGRGQGCAGTGGFSPAAARRRARIRLNGAARGLLSAPVLPPRHRARVCLSGAFATLLAVAAAAHAAAPPFPGLRTTTVASPDADVPIPDQDALTSLIAVNGVGGVVVDVDVSVDITHPQGNQLDVYLVSPSGTTVTLTTDNGGGNADVFAGTMFDDQASGMPSAPNVRNFTYTAGVATGPIQPEQALGKLVGEAPDGPWVLVVSDDTGGQTGVLHSWSLTISTLSYVAPSAPLDFVGTGGPIPDNNPSGRVSTVEVSGTGAYLYDLELGVDIVHPNAADIDMFLTAPSGRRIDVVTDVGGGNDDLWHGTTFDDHADAPASDLPLPTNGTAFGRVAGEGALSAFLGENPNGTWTLTVVDDAGGNTGTLNGWSLRIVTTSVCGDGQLDPGEQCDDGNTVDGDGCDHNCTPTGCGNGVITAGEDCDDGNTVDGDACPATCRLSEVRCDDCVDDDANGLVDALDPACRPQTLTLATATVVPSRGLLRVTGTVALAPAPGGPVGVVIADGNGPVFCGDLGSLAPRAGGRYVARGRVGAGTIKLRLVPGGRFAVAGHGLDLGALDDPSVQLGLRLGGSAFAGTGTLRAHGPRKRVYP